MQLPASYLLNYIKQYLDDEISLDEADDFLVDPPSFYQGERHLRSHTMYLASGDEVVSNLLMDLGAFLLYTGKAVFKTTTHVYHIREGVNLFFLSNVLQNLFLQMENWERSLADLVLENGTLNDLLHLAAAPFQNPLGIMNTEFQIIAEYGCEPYSIEDKETDSPYLRPETVNFLKSDELYAAVEDYQKPFLFPAGSLSRSFLCINLFYRDAFVGRLSMMKWKNKIQPWHSYFLELIRKYVMPLYIRELSQSETQNKLHRLFGELLKGGDLSWEELDSLVQVLNRSDEGQYMCVCIHPSEADFENNTLEYFARKLEDELPCTLCIAFDNEIGLLGNMAAYAGGKQEFEERLVYFLRDSNFRAGTGRVFTNLADAPFSYRQAAIALDYGMGKNPYIWKHEFDQYVLSYLVDYCLKEFPASFLCAPGLLTLKQRDQETGSDLYHTLKVYIENGKNAVQTARKLSIHRGTLIYRLEKITELTGIDLDSWQELMYLSLSYLLADHDISS